MRQLKKKRLELGILQVTLAKKARTTQPAISYIERGCNASLGMQTRIAKALGVRVEDLL